jgi:general secretion pathway protein C
MLKNQIKLVVAAVTTSLALSFGATPIVQAAPSEAPADAKPQDVKIQAKAIRKVSDKSYAIDKSLMTQALSDPTVLLTNARLVPAIADGKPAGFKVYAIRKDSLVDRMGIMNGDTIHSINGIAVTTADGALEAYSKLKDVSEIKLQLMRKGKAVELTYTIK